MRASAAARDRIPVTPRDVELLRIIAARKPAESELVGTSMGEALPGGTRIRIAPLPSGIGPRTGQVIAFLAGTQVMVHRVVRVIDSGAGAGFLVTVGDGNWLCDPPVALESVAGAVDEYLEGDEWRAVPAPARSWMRCVVAGASVALMRTVLAASPRAAARLGFLMSYLRVGVRGYWARATGTWRRD